MDPDPQTLKDSCQKKHCRSSSWILLRGVGLCSEHWNLACQKQDETGSKTITEAIASFLIPAARDFLLDGLVMERKKASRPKLLVEENENE